VIIPVGLIVRVTIGVVRVTALTLAAFFTAWWDLVLGSNADRAFALAMLFAAPLGYLSVTKLHLFHGLGPAPVAAARSASVGPRPVTAMTTPAADPVDPAVWETFSADSQAVLSQHHTGEACVLACRRNDAVVWERVGECQGGVADRHFVSNSCERSVTFHSKPPGKDRRFITVFDRTALAWTVLDVALTKVPSALARGNVVAGLAGNDGAPPRYSADGAAVDFEVVDGTTQHVPLIAEPKATPAPPPGKKKR
jgi:hypothetical protein